VVKKQIFVFLQLVDLVSGKAMWGLIMIYLNTTGWLMLRYPRGGDVSVEASCEWRQNLVQENEKCG